ncbi:MAG: RING finger protein [Planctomycetia bacterium]|nr:RING finger protein [Planctomycetia bacterium]
MCRIIITVDDIPKLPSEIRDHQTIQKVCPYCGVPIEYDEAYVVCQLCQIPHHAPCWEENGRCTTYGCEGGKDTPTPVNPHSPTQPATEAGCVLFLIFLAFIFLAVFCGG